MIIVYGTRFYGKVAACGPSFLATRFFHIWYLPLIPVGTQLVLEETGGGSYRGVDAPFSFKSMMAGYLRVWGPIGVVLAIIAGIDVLDGAAEEPAALILVGAFTGFVILALIVGVVLSYALIGKLSDEQKRHRAIYAMHTGYFVDPADMGVARQSVREGLMATIMDRSRGLASMGYRMSADPAHAWPHVALDPTHNDQALVSAAFTLARLDASMAQGPWKMQMEQLHHALWQRINQTGGPPVPP